MEKGTLSILQTKSGSLIARVTFVKPDGKQGVIDASFWHPTKEDLKYNNTSCEILREKGALEKLITNDGRIIEKNPIIASKASMAHGTPADKGGIADSYSPSHTLLPKDTKGILERINPDNFFLKWHKAARFVEDRHPDKNKFMFFKRDRKGENFEIKPNFGEIDFEQLAKREKDNAKAILGDNQTRVLNFTTQWRMVQGLGLESVYETSMTLHHVYGIPYIPASVLKGVVRSWIIINGYSGNEQDALADPRFCDWFGCPGELIVEDEEGKRKKYQSFYKEARQGDLRFFDAYPTQPPILQTDVMNPHYGPYYSDKKGNTPPADYHNPVPVFFLTIADTSFQFVLGSRSGNSLGQSLKNLSITDWLKEALTSHGIGAKTAVGYGYFHQQPPE